ncbi:MAG: bifunctional demethylmenaquinone methyltransferase/2-methoxy-6-polyprenyl-1,4-benzoquinol methylase UbiE [Vampirovibrionales bacterium]|nr:bifunctional demethylmenaquinone methyltransferase/2-methoxy-6-polyprenyl-1,4-benzoquinol methylase UbiE [Vampirovibrionales bacterium]
MTSTSSSAIPTELPAPQGQHREPLVAAMFNRIAPTYDCLNDVISFGMHRVWKRQAVKALHLKAGQTVLDVCTGTGDLLAYLAPAVGPSGKLIGVDVSADMLAVAQKRFGTVATLHHASALALPLASASVDAAMVSFGLRNVDDVPQAISEMARTLKPGGIMVSLDTTPDPWLPGYWWYFDTIMPLVGRFMSGDVGAYQYLSESSKRFAPPSQLALWFEESGLENVCAKRLAFGSVALIVGQKPAL